MQAVPWAEEVLVTKSDLDEKQQMISELQSKVDELTLQNEYQLRLKDMGYQEKIKEITDKFQGELAESKAHYEELKEQKLEMEMEFEEVAQQFDAAHARRVSEVPTSSSPRGPIIFYTFCFLIRSYTFCFTPHRWRASTTAS